MGEQFYDVKDLARGFIPVSFCQRSHHTKDCFAASRAHLFSTSKYY